MNNSTMNGKNYFTIDFMAKAIKGSQNAFNKASKGFGPQYEELVGKMKEFPNYEPVVVKLEGVSSKSKRTYKGFTEQFVEDYVNMRGVEKFINERKNIIAACEKIGEKPLPKLKSWLIEAYKCEYTSGEFEMSVALEEVRKWKLEQAAKAA